ncbi:MAG: glycosyltransferase family 4 protein [Candidatus Eisenbacteria bacterium]|nr:glycosyltransferase family 4 protein [Candidatus Eisenbacteria bacterium]
MNILQSLNFRWWNASAEYAISLSKGLSDLGHNVITFSRNGSPASNRAEELGLRVVSPAGMGSKNPLSRVPVLRSMLAVFLRERIEISNLHDGESHFLGAVASLFSGRKTKVVRTLSETRGSKANAFNLFLYRFMTDAVIVTNGWTVDALAQKFGINRERVFSVHPGIDTEKFSAGMFRGMLRLKLGIPSDVLLVGLIGRLSPVKGQYYFVKAASLLSDPRNMRFVVSGRAEEVRHEDLIETARALGVEHLFCFLGEFSDVREVIDDLDIAVVPSVGSEEISRIVLELMSMGKPVIASSVGSIPELIEDGVTGHLVPPGDAAALSDRISELTRKKEKRTFLGKAAREEAVRKFDSRNVARRVERIFEDCLQRKRR